jgi:acid phosphatase class B
MRNDVYISVSVQPFPGIEAFKIELTKDSVKLIDRLNKRYMADSYEKIKGDMAVGFNFNNLQALLSNNMFMPGKEKLTPNEFRFFRYNKKSGREAEFSIEDVRGLIYRFVADGDEKLLSTTVEDNSGVNTLKWDYSDFQNVGNKQFPMKMTARLQSDEKDKGMVKLSFSVPEIDSRIADDFKIPAGYKQVTFSQIIKSLDMR